MSAIVDTNTKDTTTGNRHVMHVYTLPTDDPEFREWPLTPPGEELVFDDGHHVVLHWSRTKVTADLFTSEQATELLTHLAVAIQEVRHKDYGDKPPVPAGVMRQRIDQILFHR